MIVCQSKQKCLLPVKAIILFENLISFSVHGSILTPAQNK